MRLDQSQDIPAHPFFRWLRCPLTHKECIRITTIRHRRQTEGTSTLRESAIATATISIVMNRQLAQLERRDK